MSYGIGDITKFSALPIQEVNLRSTAMMAFNIPIVIKNILEGSTVRISPITRRTQLGLDWTIAYDIDILVRTAEEPRLYTTTPLSGDSTSAAQFVQSANTQAIQCNVLFGKATLNTLPVGFAVIDPPEYAERQALTIPNASITTEIITGQDGFIFGEFRIRATHPNYRLDGLLFNG